MAGFDEKSAGRQACWLYFPSSFHSMRILPSYSCLIVCIVVTMAFRVPVHAQNLCHPATGHSVFLRSEDEHKGAFAWKMVKFSEAAAEPSRISQPGFSTGAWMPAVVPGTVLTSLVYNKVYPDPYYGDNNKRLRYVIPEISDVGREFYHYWFRTEFMVPSSYAGKTVWLKFHGINYRCNIWCNGVKLGSMEGMFNTKMFDITSVARAGKQNALAIDVEPVDHPGTMLGPRSRPGAIGENRNGGSGDIGKDVTMLMSIGWDFSYKDGIRDRNTGIWRDIELFATGNATLANAFVTTDLRLPDLGSSRQSVSVEVTNAKGKPQEGILEGTIEGTNIRFRKQVQLAPHESTTIFFKPEEYPQLVIDHPRVWWPLNKGSQELYTLHLKFVQSGGSVSHELTTRFGIRTITTTRNTPDSSKLFVVNGRPFFVRGTNWIPEAMCRFSEKRLETEMRYTRQAGVNFLRLWGGGIAESDYFYELCDRYGFLVWTEFWMTGDTKKPGDTALYFYNMAQTVKRIRNHPSQAIYVSSNESTDLPGARRLIHDLDSTRDYQAQSETDGVHDGSPYKYENPMQYFENTASARGTRINGFNPEYGTPCLPVIESLREMMPSRDLWPINDSVWNYMDGNAFHGMTGKYRAAINQFGAPGSIEDYAKKAQFVGAMNYRSIWEAWNYNKLTYGDRFCSGVLFWYHNSPVPQVASRMWDWSLEPTAALYYSQNALQPLHPQFDYLKNTVSVSNDFPQLKMGFSVKATVYDFNMKVRFERAATINIPADGVQNDAMRIDFPDDITQVHFILLQLSDANGKPVAESFYWRSRDHYEKPWTLTGPAVSGFEDMEHLPKTTLKVTTTEEDKHGKLVVHAVVSNPGSSLSFFTQLRLQTISGRQVKGAFYSDNFFCLLPGESRTITIESETEPGTDHSFQLVTDAFNAGVVISKLIVH